MKSFALLKREWALWWSCPTPFLYCGSLLAASGYFFFTYLNSFRQKSEQYQAGFLGAGEVPSLRVMVIEPYFETLGFLLVFIVPMIMAKLFSGDRERGFLSFLFSTPISVWDLVVAKFLAIFSQIASVLLFVSLPAFFLLAGTELSLAPAFFGVTALLFLLALYTSLGVLLSQFIHDALPLALCHFFFLLVLYFLPAVPVNALGGVGSYILLFSPLSYSGQMIEGYFSTQQIGFFIGCVVGLLGLSIYLLQQERRTGE